MADFVSKIEKQSVKLAQLLGKVTGVKRGLLQIFGLALALETFAVLSPFFMQWVVDTAIVSADYDLLTLLAIGFGLLMLIQTAVGAARSWVVLYLSSHLSVQWVSNVFSHLIHLPTSYFEKRHLGDIVTRFDSLQHIQQTLTTSFVEGVLDGLLGILMLAIIVFYSPVLAAIVVTGVVIHAAISWISYSSMRRLASEQISLGAKTQSLFLESVRAVQSIKLFGAESDRQARYVNAMVETTNRKIASQRLGLTVGTLSTLISGIENIAVVWVGAMLVMQSQLSVGMLFAFMSYKATFSGRTHALIGKFVELKMLKLQGELLADIVLSPPDAAGIKRENLDTLHEPQLGANVDASERAEIEVKNVSFRYSPTEPWILKDVNLSVAKGESLAITGPSGCGKTTLLKIMLGLIEPTSGEVLLRGKEIRSMGSSYRDSIAAVMQDDSLLSGSIAENICFFSQQPDQERIVRSAQAAAIFDDVMKMPMKFQSLIGDLGTALSGGQRQRLQIARAIYRKPLVLFFDEATSNLDVAAESRICAATKYIGSTLIAVAHREAFVKQCDRRFELGVVTKL